MTQRDTPPPDLTDAATRRRLTSTGIQAMQSIAALWGIDAVCAAGLVGVTSDMWTGWCQTPPEDPGVDAMVRMSALIGIHIALHRKFTQHMADSWPTRENTAAVFAGVRPVDAMVAGGLGVILKVRAMLDTPAL